MLSEIVATYIFQNELLCQYGRDAEEVGRIGQNETRGNSGT
jgi:hypothetical protein